MSQVSELRNLPEIRIPRAALRYVLLQRPMLQGFTGLPRRVGVPTRLRLTVDTALRGKAIVRDYRRMIQEDLEMIRPHLPDRVLRILDIGCGIAAIDLLLYRHYGSSASLELCLLDRSEPRTIPRYGYSDRAEFYNSLELSRRVLLRNGVPSESIHLLEARSTIPLLEDSVDLVLSIASWGFHYPVTTYLEEVHRVVRPSGRLILDLRRNHGQEEPLRRRFEDLVKIGETWDGKAHRYRAKKSQTNGRHAAVPDARSS
jgi:SAM-dependent methyltransferase